MCDFISKNKELFNQLDLFINSTKDEEDALMNTLLRMLKVYLAIYLKMCKFILVIN